MLRRCLAVSVALERVCDGFFEAPKCIMPNCRRPTKQHFPNRSSEVRIHNVQMVFVHYVNLPVDVG